MYATTDGSVAISPPVRSVSTSMSPSMRFVKDAAGIIDVEIEDAVFSRILEGKQRVLLRPLPLHRRVVLGDLCRVPAFLEDREHIFGLRLKLQPRDLVRPLPDVLARQRQPFLIAN